MKKILIATIYDIENFGNRLQNFALNKYIEENFKIKVDNIKTYNFSIFQVIINIAKYVINYHNYRNVYKRKKYIENNFNNILSYSKSIYVNELKIGSLKKYDYLIIGSDQVWNPYFPTTIGLFLGKTSIRNKISYSASFGVKEIPNLEKYRSLNSLKKISVREDVGISILKNITKNKNIEVLIDPTLLLNSEEWEKFAIKPKKIKNEKFILLYFLGEISFVVKKHIEKIAKEKNCLIINILDKRDPYFVSGPQEFLWLEENAEIIFTDSFHSSVFALIFNKPFVVFERNDPSLKSMNSRIETLLNKFKLKNRIYNGKEITKENLEHDYSSAYEILEEERKKSKKFLEDALDINGEEDYGKK